MKRTKVLLFVLVLVMFGLFFSGAKFRAAEIQTSDEITVLGAQVRTDDPLGIRFVGKTEGDYDKYGIAIAFGDVDVNEIVLGATVNGKAVLNAEASEKDEDGQFYISLISIPENMYGQKVTARAYVKNGEDVTYATTATTRSYYGTAKLAYEAGDKSDKVAEVYNNLPKTSFDYNGGELVSDYDIFVGQSTFGGEIVNGGKYVTIATKDKVSNGSGLYWDKLYLVSTTTENLYKIVATTKSGEKTQSAVDYEYVLAAHSDALNNQSYKNVNKIVSLTNATDYYLYFEMPSTTNCSLNVKVASNPEILVNSAYLDLTEKLPVVKKNNYTFIGWYDNEELTGSRTLVYTGASKYYAKYAPTYYYIYYYMNGGDCNVAFANSYCVESDEILLPDASSMTIDNGYFLGWYDNSAFTGDPITTLDTSKGGDIHLYAKWFINTKTVVELSAADIAALNALEPTIVVSSAFDNGTYEVNGNDYVMNDTAFASVADACSAAPENAKIYVFPGTYSESITISSANVTLYGPNYNIKGMESRNDEANITEKLSVAANGVTINGIKFTSKGNIGVAGKNITITNIYMDPTSTLKTSGANRQGCIADEAACTNLVISNSYIDAPGTANSYDKQFLSLTSVTGLSLIGNYITNSEQKTTSGSYAAMRIYNCAGVITISNNTINWGTTGYLWSIGDYSNSCTRIDVIENVISDNSLISTTAGMQFRRGGSTQVINIIGNTFNNCSGSTLMLGYYASSKYYYSSATVNVKYNNFASGTSYKIGYGNSATFVYENNYYAVAQTTATSDYGVITSVAALEAAYAKYKAQ